VITLLDTDFCIDWLRRKEYARKALALLRPADVAVSAATVGELLVGAQCAQVPAREADKVHAFLKPLPVLDFSLAEAVQFAAIAGWLRRQGQPIGVQDAMIAATALVRGSAVVTKNVRHFERVQGLQVCNWMAVPPGRS